MTSVTGISPKKVLYCATAASSEGTATPMWLRRPIMPASLRVLCAFSVFSVVLLFSSKNKNGQNTENTENAQRTPIKRPSHPEDRHLHNRAAVVAGLREA